MLVPNVLVTVIHHTIQWERLCNYFMVYVKKGVNQLLGDANCETSQWLEGSSCPMTSLEANCA